MAHGPEGARELVLVWDAFVPEDRTEVEGSIGGRTFRAWVPLH